MKKLLFSLMFIFSIGLTSNLYASWIVTIYGDGPEDYTAIHYDDGSDRVIIRDERHQ